ncbi:patatin-like phospholipase family protein [Tunturibacter empetritectus]|uniref:patatin-like phospholipase family protein n=1 Tax=Tunturiibacter empetritectus TaxID=3069691 RepID=UPI00160C52A3|nr:patatin-like phospholipase family protein [Edaphobacter lichenicola]
MKTIVAAALLVLWPASLRTWAQRPTIEPPTRQRIGLVLEGGGALGFAHVGVIEWMEDHHIPVDDIAGTSMGGLIGGLYASGNSPQEIEDFVGGINWPAVLSGQLPFPALSYRRKEDKLAFPNRLEFGLKHGLSLPNGLNSGSAVGLLLDREMLPYYDLKNFDDLPIPFRCVATDITTGKEHVFKDGSLAQAMRSTMSIPGVFAPVAHGDQIYSDGGAVNNLPVDVARSMGAEVVIAVYLDTGPVDKASLNSLVGVAGRNVAIMVSANELESMKNANILLKADVSKFSSSEFERSAEIIPQGVKVAEEHAAELEKYALNDADWRAYVAQRDARRRTKIPAPQFVSVRGVKGAQRAEIANGFMKYVGKPVDSKKIEETIADLQGTGTYSNISYNLVDEKNKTGLLVRPQIKDYGPPFLDVGPTLASNDSNDIQLGLGGRVTFFGLTGPGSEIRLDASVGKVAGVSGELYQPLVAAKRYFVAPRAYYAHTITSLYSGSQELSQYTEERNGLGLDLGYRFSSKAELRVGEDYQWYGETLRVGQPIEQIFHLTPFVSNVRFQYLGQDNVQVPTRGSELLTKYTHSTQRPFGEGGYSQWDTRVAHFLPARQKGIIFGTMEGGTSFGATNLGLAGFSLGGALRLSAYGRGELLGSDYFLGQVGYLYRLTKLNPVIGDSIYAAGFYEIGKVWNAAPGTPTLPNDISGAVVVKTILGPFYGGGSVGDSGHRKWFFGLGRVF